VNQHWGDIPFLFKVLSVRTALSIQAHPDRALARALHARRPDLYKDGNHKPELALAITPFEALCRFRPVDQITSFLQTVPELRGVVGDTAASAFNALPPSESAKEEALKTLFSSLMTASPESIASHLLQLIDRLKTHGTSNDADALALRLYEQYPGDVGVFCSYLLNRVELHPGEAIYLGPNEPHAYIRGDCFECMATSDNVVRAGLTPKLKDVTTLCNMLTYASGPPQLLAGVVAHKDGGNETRVYAPPVEEFQVEVITITTDSYTLRASRGPSILVTYSGSGKLITEHDCVAIHRGIAAFAIASASVSITKTSEEALVIYRACVNDAFWR
jgi:mannose-6-phosphate isomerase